MYCRDASYRQLSRALLETQVKAFQIKSSYYDRDPLLRPSPSIQPRLRNRYNIRQSSSISTSDAEASTAKHAAPEAPIANPFELKSRHGDFQKIQASRKPFDQSSSVEVSRTPQPNWRYGDGVNKISGQHLKHVEIDPNGSNRAMVSNYKLLISGVPRPISFVSTMSKDGMRNLAPFSYFQVIDHDPPIFVIGFSARPTRLKDTRRNLIETGECVINIVSEHMIEAVNATSLDVPYGTSEWELSGLKSAASTTVRPDRVQDAIFSVEGKLLEMKELNYHGEAERGKATGALALIEASRFWIREDAINETLDDIDLATLRPLVQLGGISYGRVRETFELPRPRLKEELENESKGLKAFLTP